jgi:hypothetical protein
MKGGKAPTSHGAPVTTPTKARIVAQGTMSRVGPRTQGVGNVGVEKDDSNKAKEKAAGV